MRPGLFRTAIFVACHFRRRPLSAQPLKKLFEFGSILKTPKKMLIFFSFKVSYVLKLK